VPVGGAVAQASLVVALLETLGEVARVEFVTAAD
jgi:hypothetical protein